LMITTFFIPERKKIEFIKYNVPNTDTIVQSNYTLYQLVQSLSSNNMESLHIADKPTLNKVLNSLIWELTTEGNIDNKRKQSIPLTWRSKYQLRRSQKM
jgi:hypothetical protein